jgi:hypothetical protein
VNLYIIFNAPCIQNRTNLVFHTLGSRGCL